MAASDLKRRIVAQFSAENKAKGVIAGFRQDLDSTGRTMRRMASSVLALAGIGGLGYLLKQTMSSIDRMAKMSDELHISTEALGGLEHAAKISGTSIENLHKGLEIFVRRMGEAKHGIGEGVRGLEMLGMSADEVISMGTEKAFMEIAERISEAGTAAEQAGIAYNFFGRQGMQLLNMFQQGKVGIEELTDEAEKLGLTFSRLDAAKVEAANDALTRARGVITGLVRSATIELAPYIEVLATKFVDLATSGEGMGHNVTNVFELMTQAAVRLGSTIQMLGVRHKQINAIALEGMAKYFGFLEKIDFIPQFKGMEYLFKKKFGVGFGEFSETLREEAKEWKSELADLEKTTKEKTSQVEKFFDDLRSKAEQRRIELEKKSTERMAAYGGTIDLDVSTDDKWEQYWNNLPYEKSYQAMQERMAKQKYETSLAVTTKIMEEEKKQAEQLERWQKEHNLKKAEEQLELMQNQIAKREEMEKQSAERRKRIAEDVALSMARGWTNALDRMMFEGQKFWDSMKQMSRSLIREIANIILYKKVAEPIAYSLMGLMPTGQTKYGQYELPTVGKVPSAAGGTMAKYQTGGLAKETGPAWLHIGEEVLRPDQRRSGDIEFHVHNEGNDKLEVTRSEQYIFSDKRIIDVTMGAMSTNVQYQMAIARAAR